MYYTFLHPSLFPHPLCRLQSFIGILTSQAYLSTIYDKKGIKFRSSLSLRSSVHDFISIPLAGWRLKFSSMLSMIMTLGSARPNLLRSFKYKSLPCLIVCYLKSLKLIDCEGSIVSITQLAQSGIAAVKITSSYN